MLTLVSQILLQDFRILIIIRRIFVYGLYIAVAWAVALTNPDDEKKPRFRMNVTEFKPEGCLRADSDAVPGAGLRIFFRQQIPLGQAESSAP